MCPKLSGLISITILLIVPIVYSNMVISNVNQPDQSDTDFDLEFDDDEDDEEEVVNRGKGKHRSHQHQEPSSSSSTSPPDYQGNHEAINNQTQQPNMASGAGIANVNQNSGDGGDNGLVQVFNVFDNNGIKGDVSGEAVTNHTTNDSSKGSGGAGGGSGDGFTSFLSTFGKEIFKQFMTGE